MSRRPSSGAILKKILHKREKARTIDINSWQTDGDFKTLILLEIKEHFPKKKRIALYYQETWMKRRSPVWTWPVAPPHKSITLPQRTFPHFHSSQTYLSLFRRGLWHNLLRDGDAFDFFWSWNCLYWAFKNMISEDDYWYWVTTQYIKQSHFFNVHSHS